MSTTNTIEQNLQRIADAQERTATALEALLAHLGSSTSFAGTAIAGTVEETVDNSAAEAKAAEEAAAAKKKADAAAAKKKADAKKAEEEAAAAAAAAAEEVDPLGDAGGETEKEYALDDVRKALMDYRAIEGAPAMMEILKTHGKAEALSSVKPENFAAIMKAVNVS